MILCQKKSWNDSKFWSRLKNPLQFSGTVRHYYIIVTLLLHHYYINITLLLHYYYIIITLILHYYYIIIPRYSEAGDLRLSGSLHVHLLSGQNNEAEDNCHYPYIFVTFYPVKL